MAGSIDASIAVTWLYDVEGIIGPELAARAGSGRIISGFVRARKRE